MNKCFGRNTEIQQAQMFLTSGEFLKSVLLWKRHENNQQQEKLADGFGKLTPIYVYGI